MRALPTVIVAAVIAVASCGGDDDDSGEGTTTVAAETAASATTVPPATTAPVATTVAAGPDTTAAAGAYVAGADPEADAVATAWTTAFDSTVDFATKAPYIADAEALQPTIEAYTPAGEAVGGIALVPTSIVITGDTAAVTYDVMFAGQVAYQGQEGTVERVDGEWVVSRDEFCSFMASARNPCAG
jgi:iron complex transport system substrate-binding protein